MAVGMRRTIRISSNKKKTSRKFFLGIPMYALWAVAFPGAPVYHTYGILSMFCIPQILSMIAGASLGL